MWNEIKVKTTQWKRAGIWSFHMVLLKSRIIYKSYVGEYIFCDINMLLLLCFGLPTYCIVLYRIVACGIHPSTPHSIFLIIYQLLPWMIGLILFLKRCLLLTIHHLAWLCWLLYWLMVKLGVCNNKSGIFHASLMGWVCDYLQLIICLKYF